MVQVAMLEQQRRGSRGREDGDGDGEGRSGRSDGSSEGERELLANGEGSLK